MNKIISIFLISTAIFTINKALACTPSPTTGADSITCDGSKASTLDLMGGRDTINAINFSDIVQVIGETYIGNNHIADNDTITADLSSIDFIFGSRLLGNNNTGSSDTITIRNNSSVKIIYGDDFYLETTSANNNKGGDDIISIDQSYVDTIIGDNFNGNNNIGGNDTIIITDVSFIKNSIYGDIFGLGTQNVGGNDIITINGSTVSDFIYGDIFYTNDNVGGDDVITVENNSTVYKSIYGDAFSDQTTGNQGGNDIITITNSYISGTIYGDYMANIGGNDIINLTNASIGEDILTHSGNDIINYTSGTVGGVIDGGDGRDRFNVSAFSGSMADISPSYISIEDFGVTNNSSLNFEDSYTTDNFMTFNVDNTSSLILTGAGSGNYIINADVVNNGLFDFSDDNVGDNLIITKPANHVAASGNLSGSGTFKFDTDFINQISDTITVNGDITSQGQIDINPISKEGSGIKKITLIKAPNDANKADENFSFVSRLQYGGDGHLARAPGSIYIWNLKTSGNDWVLTNSIEDNGGGDAGNGGGTGGGGQVIVPEIPAYTNLPTLGREIVMSELDTLHTRLGELRNNKGWVGSGSSNLKTNLGSNWHNMIDFDDSKANAWIKGSFSYIDLGAKNSFDSQGNYGGINLGIDKKFNLTSQWNIYTGLFGAYKMGDFETSGETKQYRAIQNADIDVDTWSLGAYATFYNTAGTYIDLIAEYINLSSDITTANKISLDGYALASSIELGHSFDLGKNWIIEPQAQAKIAHISWNDYYDGANDILFDSHTYFTARFGTRIEKTLQTSKGEIKPWAYLGVSHEFTGTPQINYSDNLFETHNQNIVAEARIGITADIANAVQIYSHATYASDFAYYDAIRGDLGIRIHW